MDNETRVAIYTRDRTTMTPAQRRRVRHRQNGAVAPLGRRMLRKAHRDVKRADTRRRAAIRVLFSRRPR